MSTPAGSLASLAAAILLLLMGGCSRPPVDAAAATRVAPEYDPATGRLTRIAYDANGNGVHDSWGYMDGTRLIRLEADENENGRLDRWEYYPAAARGAKVPPERIDRSLADDGRVTRREFFEGTEMTRVEEDTDGNGVVDKWESYRDGALSTLSLDENGDGKADRRLVYRPDGSLDHIEVDADGSGQFRRLTSS
jgi:hypothetical protein